MIFGPFIGALILIYPVWCIFRRAGFSPWLSLLLFIPVFGGLVVLAVLAFADWPAAPRGIGSGRAGPPASQ